LLPVKAKISLHAVLLEKRLDGLTRPDPRQGASVSVACKEDIEAIVEHPEALSKLVVYLNRIRNGDICFCLKQDDKLVSYNWIRFTTCCAYCGRRVGFGFIPLKQSQAFTYDFYTYKKHRGKGLGGYLKSCILFELQSRGITEVLTIIEPANEISLKIHARLDYEPVTVVFGYGIFNWTKTFLGSKKDGLLMRRWVKNVCGTNNND